MLLIYSTLLLNIHKVKYSYSIKRECINLINFFVLSKINLLLKVDVHFKRKKKGKNCNYLLENFRIKKLIGKLRN